MDAGLLDEKGHRRALQKFVVLFVQDDRLQRVFATMNVRDFEARCPRLQAGQHTVQIHTETMKGQQVGSNADRDFDPASRSPQRFLR